jgi:hypothetical protein
VPQRKYEHRFVAGRAGESRSSGILKGVIDIKTNLTLKVAAIALAGALALTGYELTAAAATAAPITTTQTKVKAEDTDAAWNASTAIKITLNGTSATSSGSGATVKGGVVTISKAGTYAVSGKLTNGQIVIAAAKTETVRLVLNGAEITNPTGAPIYASTCDKLIITLADGTTNTMTDGGAKFAYALPTDEEPNAAVFSKSDLTINGKGAISVNAGFKNGIASKDDLIIASGNITVNAANQGIRGNDSVTILGGTFAIKAGNDGIQTNNETDADKGWLDISGGTFNITSAHDGIQADTTLNISNGTFNISAGGGASKKLIVTDGDTASTSYKGVKAAGYLTISGGTLTIDSYDDGVHSNAAITISGGELTIATGDDGMHADGDLTVKGGKITVKQSYEGLEGNNIYISGGTVIAVASDDGLNAAGGADGSGLGGRMGGDRFAAGGSHTITISGGAVTLYANSDVFDSNGSISVTGGTVCAFKMQGEGELLDMDGGATIVPALFGSGQMAAGTKLSVASGSKSLWSGTVANASSSFALILPGLTNGTSYTVQNGSVSATLTATTSISSMGGGRGGMGVQAPRNGQVPSAGGQRPGRGY